MKLPQSTKTVLSISANLIGEVNEQAFLVCGALSRKHLRRLSYYALLAVLILLEAVRCIECFLRMQMFGRDNTLIGATVLFVAVYVCCGGSPERVEDIRKRAQ